MQRAIKNHPNAHKKHIGKCRKYGGAADYFYNMDYANNIINKCNRGVLPLNTLTFNIPYYKHILQSLLPKDIYVIMPSSKDDIAYQKFKSFLVMNNWHWRSGSPYEQAYFIGTMESEFSRDRTYLHVCFHKECLTYATDSDGFDVEAHNCYTIDEFFMLIRSLMETLNSKLDMLFI